jgi:hypothetical protein
MLHWAAEGPCCSRLPDQTGSASAVPEGRVGGRKRLLTNGQMEAGKTLLAPQVCHPIRPGLRFPRARHPAVRVEPHGPEDHKGQHRALVAIARRNLAEGWAGAEGRYSIAGGVPERGQTSFGPMGQKSLWLGRHDRVALAHLVQVEGVSTQDLLNEVVVLLLKDRDGNSDYLASTEFS